MSHPMWWQRILLKKSMRPAQKFPNQQIYSRQSAPTPKDLICQIPRFWRIFKPSAQDARPGAMAIWASLILYTAQPRASRSDRSNFYQQTRRSKWPLLPPLGRSLQPSGPQFYAKPQIFMKAMQRRFLRCSPMRPVKR